MDLAQAVYKTLLYYIAALYTHKISYVLPEGEGFLFPMLMFSSEKLVFSPFCQ